MNVEHLIENFSEENLRNFFRSSSDRFRPIAEPEDEIHHLKENQQQIFATLNSLGEIEFNDIEKIIICASKLNIPLSERTSKKQQYEVARRIIKAKNADGGIFTFYDDSGRFRFSFIRVFYTGTKREFSTYKRYSFFVDPKLTNKTFRQQIEKATFSSLNNIQKTFSIEAVTDAFYNEFKPKFESLSNNVKNLSKKDAQNFTLLFVIRIIFLGFVQKKGWLGDNNNFLQDYLEEYKAQNLKDIFYRDWLEPLFFEALNSPPGRKVKYQNNTYSKETEAILQMAPFLNGELFKPHKGLDRIGAYIPDDDIAEFIEFLFQYNFTIEENTNIDEELELSPEFLGIIFERLVNKADGAVYTPRTEVDYMCRLSLVKWLEKNTSCRKKDLFELFFREGGHEDKYDEHQRDGDFTAAEIRELVEKLQSITICDPAAGSGAFEVGMMQVLNEIIGNLQVRHNAPDDVKKIDNFDRKKNIIARSLYGVEVKHWAVWINQLRLWLSLFIDMPDEQKTSRDPLLPSLNFKVRVGDSLVQRVGGKIFPIHGHANLSASLKGEVTKLRKLKSDFYNNIGRISDKDILSKEKQLFQKILEAEIEEKQKKLQQSSCFKPKQTSLDLGIIEPKQEVLDTGKKQELENEIQSLQEELKAIKSLENRPFIWSIEFAEIFYDKGGFDIIIGNPPYVRQESIADPSGYIEKPKEYKGLLKQVVEADYPDYFAKTKTTYKKKIDGKSDLYTYFYAHTLKLLNAEGIHCFICSNSWLDVGFGVWLQELLLNHVQMRYIIDNHAKRSFASADVNTVITIFDAPQKKVTWQDEPVRFVAFKKPFEEVVITENLLEIEEAKETIVTDSFRSYLISHKDLKEEGIDDQKYIGEKWGGKYLRAPDVFLGIIKKEASNIARIDELGYISILGYVHDNNTGANYPKTLFIKTVKDTKRILLTSEDCINFGVNESGNNRQIAPILFPRTFGENHLVLYNQCGAVGKEFYRVVVNDAIITDRDLCLYFNSTFILLQRELMGLVGLGGGALKFSAYDLAKFYIPKRIPNISSLSGIENFLSRATNSPLIECGIDPTSDIPIEEQEPNPLPDRKALDDVIFDALNLTEEERKDVYRAVCRLVWNRISKAKNK